MELLFALIALLLCAAALVVSVVRAFRDHGRVWIVLCVVLGLCLLAMLGCIVLQFLMVGGVE